MTSFEIKNKLRDIDPIECGDGCETLIIGSVGTSRESDQTDIEIEKARIAQERGADAVTDHSFYGDIPGYHEKLVEELDVIVSTVGSYEFAAQYHNSVMEDADHTEPIEVLEQQVKRGVDMITVHASFLRSDLDLLEDTDRVIPMTSKGGGIVSSYMRLTGRENPYYTEFDEILDLFKKYDVTLSLGTSFRTATVCDSWDTLLASEVEMMSELTERALDRGVKVMVEGMGHVPIDEIPAHVEMTKRMCHDVPYRVLPMSTDIALGYDHISGAIGAAVAVGAGADAVTAISRAEHIALPNKEDLKEAIVAAKIGAHAGELAQLGDFSRDYQMSRTRWDQGCKGDWTVAIDPEYAENALKERGRLNDQLVQCDMCGDHCGIVAGNITADETQTREESDD